MMKLVLLATCLVFLCACDVSVSHQQPVTRNDPGTDKGREKAIAAARQFVIEIDKGNFEDTWEAAAPHIKEQLSKTTWGLTLSGMRTTLGAPTNRKSLGSAYTRS